MYSQRLNGHLVSSQQALHRRFVLARREANKPETPNPKHQRRNPVNPKPIFLQGLVLNVARCPLVPPEDKEAGHFLPSSPKPHRGFKPV